MKIFHKHKWIQVKDITINDKKGRLLGFIVFCEKCHQVRKLGIDDCPYYTYSKDKEGIDKK